MAPKTPLQNILLWLLALSIGLLLAFLGGIATHWPKGGEIDWQEVILGVINTAIALIPVVAAGLGLPTLGREAHAMLISAVGTRPAKVALEEKAIEQKDDERSAMRLARRSVPDSQAGVR